MISPIHSPFFPSRQRSTQPAGAPTEEAVLFRPGVRGVLLATVFTLLARPGLAQIADEPSGPVAFADDALASAVSHALAMQEGLPVFPEDLQALTRLVARGKGITNLIGLEYAPNLEKLDLRDNDIQDLTPLAELRGLHWLSVRENPRLRDLHPLRTLTNLRYLNINRNTAIASVQPLAHLHRLETLLMRDVPVLHNHNEQRVIADLPLLNRLNIRHTGLPSVVMFIPGLAAGRYAHQFDIRDNPLTDGDLIERFDVGQ